MTEEEAKTKWCCGPPMNIMAAGIASGKRELGAGDGQCVASACMAWRKAKVHPKYEYEVGDQKPTSNESSDAAWVPYPGDASQSGSALRWMRQTNANTADGYCGLAGTPQ